MCNAIYVKHKILAAINFCKFGEIRKCNLVIFYPAKFQILQATVNSPVVLTKTLKCSNRQSFTLPEFCPIQYSVFK